MKMKNIDTVVTGVATWNANAGNIPSDDPNVRDRQLYDQLKLVLEELNELNDAIAAGDDVEIIDAVCDINVVAAYAALLMSTPTTYFNPDFSYDVSDVGVDTIFVSEHSTPCDFDNDTVGEIIDGGLCLLGLLLEDEDTFSEKCALQYHDKLYKVLYGIGQYLYIVGSRCYGENVMDKSMAQVLETNNAKFMAPDVAKEKLQATIESYQGRYENIVVHQTPLGSACFRCDNGKGKIVKPYDWVAPDIKSILENEGR